MNSILIINILIFALLSGITIAGFLFIKALLRNFREFITPPGDDKPSPLSLTFDALASILARHMGVEVKTTIAGMLSGQSRGDAAENLAAGEIDLSLDNPAAAGLIAMLPKKYQKLAYKNPMITKLLVNKLGSMGGGSKEVVPTASGNGNKPKFNL